MERTTDEKNQAVDDFLVDVSLEVERALCKHLAKILAESPCCGDFQYRIKSLRETF